MDPNFERFQMGFGFHTKRLMAVEVFKPTLEQKASKLILSFSSTRAVKVACAIDITPFCVLFVIIITLLYANSK